MLYSEQESTMSENIRKGIWPVNKVLQSKGRDWKSTSSVLILMSLYQSQFSVMLHNSIYNTYFQKQIQRHEIDLPKCRKKHIFFFNMIPREDIPRRTAVAGRKWYVPNHMRKSTEIHIISTTNLLLYNNIEKMLRKLQAYFMRSYISIRVVQKAPQLIGHSIILQNITFKLFCSIHCFWDIFYVTKY